MNEQQHSMLVTAQMSALRAQVNPHFLFNALNLIGVTALVESSESVMQMVESVGNILRYSLYSNGIMTLLDDEVEIVRQYLSLQKRRFGDMLTTEVQNELEGEDYTIPSMTIQPLVENCFKHAFGNKKQLHIRVFIALDEDDIQISVTDNGVGFDPKHKTGGIGLNNIRRRLALQYGEERARMEIESEPDKFSTVTLYIPVDKEKVLIVEDELLESAALVRILETRYSGKFSPILTARDGEQAVELALREKPALILMDINLPALSGVEAAHKIVQQLPDIKLIMVSAYSDYEHLRQSMRNHAVDYIVKPYSVETLCEAVNRVLMEQPENELYGRAAVVEQVKKYLQEHYAEDVTLQQVASSVNLDKSYLGRIFREVSGVTVMGYLKEVRLTHAKEQLLRGRPAAEVAIATGFGDPAYFSRYFKQTVGCTPTQYRKDTQT